MKKFAYLLLILLAGNLATEAFGQHPTEMIRPRDEDHFWRKRIVTRIDLSEKINAPLVEVESPELYANSQFGSTSGIIAALFDGLKSGKYLAYDPDNLESSLTYDDVKDRFTQIEGNVDPYETDWEIDEEIDGELMEEYEFEEEFEWENDGNLVQEEDILNAGPQNEGIDLTAFESVMELIEDQIVDKNRSDMVHDIQYIRIVWVDPGETLPDKNFLCLKYSDVVELLDDTKYNNKHNEAESRTAREIMDLRMFNSYVINVSGRGVRTMNETDYRKNQLTEYEHNLWSY